MVLGPGPDIEVKTGRRIYTLFVVERRSEREIAEILNADGLRTDLDRPWNRAVIRQILTNEKYVGNNVYNRISFKLKQKRVVNTPDMWVRADGAFDAIVDTGIYMAAQSIFADRARRFSDAELLSLLTDLLALRGTLSGMIIDEVDDMPSSAAYRHRFGSLLRAYSMIGYLPERDYRYLETNRVLRQMHPDIVTDTVQEVRRLGGTAQVDAQTDLILVNSEVTLSIVVVRCHVTTAGSRRWKIRLDAGLAPDITVAVRLGADNRNPQDYYLLPWLDMGTNARIRMAEDNGIDIDAYRADDLQPLYHLLRRHHLTRAA